MRPSLNPSNRWLRTTCLCLGTLLPGVAHAGPATDQPVVAAPDASNIALEASETYSYDANPLRLERNYKSLQGSDTTATLILNEATPRSKFTSSSTIDQGIYDNSVFNSTNFHEKANIGTNNLRWTARMGATFDYDTTRTSEITSFGITTPSVRHTGYSASPGIDFKPAPDDKYSINTSISRSSYDNAAFTDYNYYTVTPTYNHIFDPVNTGILMLNTERYQGTNNTRSKIDTVGPSLGLVHIINDNMTARVTAGAENSRQAATATARASSDINYVFSGSLNITERADRATIFASRQQQPFGNGSSALFTTVRANDTHALNEKLSLNAGASYRYADYINQTGTNLDDEMLGNAGISYRVVLNADISANYQFIRQSLTNTTGTIKEHLFTVGLTYHPAPWGF